MAVPPPPLGSQPLSGSTTVDLPGNSLTQWASHVQDVTSGMRLPPEAAASCPQSEHSWCVGLTGGTDLGAILPTLFWSLPKVSVLCHPSPGSWPDIGLVDTTHSELRGYGLFHRDHSQHLCSWGNSPELPTTWDASTRGHGHVVSSHYGELAGNCRCQ